MIVNETIPGKESQLEVDGAERSMRKNGTFRTSHIRKLLDNALRFWKRLPGRHNTLDTIQPTAQCPRSVHEQEDKYETFGNIKIGFIKTRLQFISTPNQTPDHPCPNCLEVVYFAKVTPHTQANTLANLPSPLLSRPARWVRYFYHLLRDAVCAVALQKVI